MALNTTENVRQVISAALASTDDTRGFGLFEPHSVVREELQRALEHADRAQADLLREAWDRCKLSLDFEEKE